VLLSTGGYKGTQQRRRRRRLHEGKAYQPGVPTGPRNAAAVARHEENHPATKAVEVPTSVRREHEGRVSQPGVPGHRRFGAKLDLPFSNLLGLGTLAPSTPLGTAEQAYLDGGQNLSPRQRSYLRATAGGEGLALVERARVQGLSGHENLKEVDDLTNAILAATGVGDLAALVGKGGAEEAASVAAGSAAKDATAAAEKDAATTGIRAAFEKAGARKAAATTAVKQAAKDAEPEVVQQAREKGEAAARAFADRTPEGVKQAAKVGTKAVAWPFRHPILAPVALQVPTALIKREPGAVEAGFDGSGTYAHVIGAIGGAASHINPILGEAVTLPASVFPSAYLAGKAGVSAASGDPAELDALLKQWKETGVLPDLAQGDVSGALGNLGEHPLYGALEASGALNAAGRLGGAAARGLPGEFGDLSRPDLPVRGTNVSLNREYSRDALRQAIQRAYDHTPHGKEARADTARGRHYLKEAANRHSSGQEAIRREHAHEDVTALQNVLPRRGPRLKVRGHIVGKLDRHSAEVVNLAVERIIQHPETFSKDLSDYKDLLEKARDARTKDGKPALDKREAKANKELVAQIDSALKRAHPGHVVDAAEAFIKLQEPILSELVDLGLLTKDQAAKASATSFARVHLGAEHGEPENLYRDLEAQIKSTRQGLRAEARAHLAPPDEVGRPGGFAGAVRTAKSRLQTAEGGYVQAERDYARLRATISKSAKEARTEKVDVTGDVADRILYGNRIEGGDRSAGPLNRLTVAQRAVEEGKRRVEVAKVELRETQAALEKEAKALARRLKVRTAPMEALLKHHRNVGAQLLNEHGYPLSLQEIEAEMHDRGIEPPGFLSHRAPANSDFYQPSFGGATLEKGGRTGKAVVSGSQLGGVDSLVRQLRRSRGLVDRARAWNKAVDRFGVEVKEVDTAADAKKAQADPARYGLDPATKPTPVPRYPFMARKGEIEGALENQSPSVAEDSAGATLARAIDDAQHGALPKDAKVVFMPEAVVKQLRADAEPSPGGLKAMQAVTTGFKRTVLPFSPSFYIGNGLDNLIRTVLSGANPAHFALGVKAAHALSAEQRAELLAGAHYASVDAIAPHRTVDAVVTGYDPLSKGVRSFAEWSHKHGWKQAAVKAGPRLFSAFSHYLLTTNALLSEKLPQYGVLGKSVLKDIRKTQGSWAKAITHLDEAVQEFAKGAENPDRMIQLQKDLERVYGNYTRMSPGARKVWSTITPFWLWTRAAYKFTYLTMPANHSIATGLLAASANATRSEREQYGLDKEGKEPVPEYYQGIPLPDGGVLPLANYNSFDYSSDPYEAISSLTVPQIKSVVEAIGGKTWKGDEVKGGNRAKAALWAAASSFVPLMNDLTEEGEEGSRHLAPHLSLPHPVSAAKVQQSREPWETISIPQSDTEGESGSFGSGSSFGESWANRSEASAGQAFGEAWADR
jgi:hypothetical protein